MSSPDSAPPPPYSAVGSGDPSSTPYNPAYTATGYAPVPPVDPNYSGPPYSGQPPYYGPPPPGMGQPPPMCQQPHQQHTVIVSQPYVAPAMVVMSFGETPIQTVCPHCQGQVITSVEYESGLLTWIICIVLAVFGCWIFCCLIPFCIDACKDVVHNCPSCRRRIAVYRRIR